MQNAFKISMDSLAGFLGVANHPKGRQKGALAQSSNARKARIEASEQFVEYKVIDRMPKVPYQQSKASLAWNYLFRRELFAPQHELQYIKPDLDKLSTRSEALRVTWLGHSSLFIEMNSMRFLVDPVFEFASPLVAKAVFDRNVVSPVSREELPCPDVIVISHDHYDHLEKSTIKFYADKPVRFLVPLGVGLHLENWGIDPNRIDELDWWESISVNGVMLTSAPANHNSGRTGLDNNATLWCSWAIQSNNGSVFYSGDTAYDSHFKEIKNRLGHFHIAFIEVAANVKDGVGFPVENCGHMQARHTMKAFEDLGADMLFPVHWSTFELFTHRWDEPMEDLILEANRVGALLVTPMIGEIVDLYSAHNTSFWWWEEELANGEFIGGIDCSSFSV